MLIMDIFYTFHHIGSIVLNIFDEYTQLGEYNYNTIINSVANIPNYCMYYLQQSNIHKKTLPTVVVPNAEKI